MKQDIPVQGSARVWHSDSASLMLPDGNIKMSGWHFVVQ